MDLSIQASLQCAGAHTRSYISYLLCCFHPLFCPRAIVGELIYYDPIISVLPVCQLAHVFCTTIFKLTWIFFELSNLELHLVCWNCSFNCSEEIEKENCGNGSILLKF